MKGNFDSQNFKSRDAASYNTLTEQFDYFTESLSRPLAKRMLELAELSPNDRILDVGTGTGIVALQAAQIVNGAGTVCGIDLSPEMLTKAAENAARLKVDQKVNFQQMDAEKLNFEDQTFDKVVSLFALLHFPSPLAALKESFRVLRPGGQLVIAVGSGIPLFSPFGWLHILRKIPNVFRSLQGRELTAPAFLDNFVNKYVPQTAEPEESHFASHHRNRAQGIRSLVKTAGFQVLKTSWLGNQKVIETPEQFWEIQRTFSSIARKRLSTIESSSVEILRTKFLEQCRNVQSQGGKLVYPFGAFYVVGRRQN